MAWQLYYWPDIPGRGELVRLGLEYTGVRYTDVARQRGADAVHSVLGDPAIVTQPFAPPVLMTEEGCLAQTANILLYLGERYGLAPADVPGRFWTHQLQLTLADWLVEVHDTHHPLGPTLHYEDQRAEAERRAAVFHQDRLPAFMQYFERALDANPTASGWLVGDSTTYADLSLFQMLEGLSYAFPEAMRLAAQGYPRMHALRDLVRTLPGVAAYLVSDRRLAFSEQGIFRRYPELDASGPV